MKRSLTALLCAALVMLPMRPRSEERVLLECIVAITIVVGGVVIVVALKNMCDKLPKQASPPPQPPVPAPPGTNAPPKKPSVKLDGSPARVTDISDWHLDGPDGQPFTALFVFRLESGDRPDAFTESLSVTGWVSATWVLTACNGTNQLVRRGQETVLNLEPRERRFFRLAAP